MRRERPAWLVPTAVLCAAWLVATALAIAAQRSTGGALPGPVAKIGPFLLAGLAAARLAVVATSPRRARMIAAGVLAIVASAGWTAVSAVSPGMAPDEAALLFVGSIPVLLFGSVWAYAGMAIGAPAPATRAPTQRELDDLERELRDEAARERDRDRA